MGCTRSRGSRGFQCLASLPRPGKPGHYTARSNGASLRYHLPDLLLLIIPVAFLAMAFRPATPDATPFQWRPFALDTLPGHLEQDRDVLVLVKSVYGGFSKKWYESISTHREMKRLVDSEALIPMEMEFAYVTTAPVGLEKEYEWVYQQDTYIKSTFSVLHLSDGSTRIYPWYVEPSTVIDDIHGWSPSRTYTLLAIGSTVIVVGRMLLRLRRREKIAV